ncbi:MAG: hypothetical protein JXA83_16300 [Acidimicrobiales bacterium]|nr:hypothetical protein [Acidimicrobiales bacterium]
MTTSGEQHVTTIEAGDDRQDADGTRRVPAALRIAALASLAAGAIHAAAAGAHSEHRAAVVAFASVAVLQIGWGALVLARPHRLAVLAGAVVNAGALVGWALAKTSGIGAIDGLDVKEPAQFADSLAAGSAAVAVVGALVTLSVRAAWVARPRPVVVGAAALAAVALAVPGMVVTGSHSHDGGDHGDDHAAGHDDAHADGAHADDAHADGGHDDDHADHAAATQPAEPYDATLPVDLGGVAGVSAEEQAEAEALVTETIQKLPQFSDWTTLEDRGWYSIGDGVTGFEHYINWPLIEDGKLFDPDAPESLVFKVDGDQKELVAAMYMTSRDVTLETVPDLGGDLVQWHIHDDLCYTGPENRWRVAGVVAPPDPCPAGTFRHEPSAPMIHVWITPHECGPFASLEGVGAGQVAAGEERACDHEHGAPS